MKQLKSMTGVWVKGALAVSLLAGGIAVGSTISVSHAVAPVAVAAQDNNEAKELKKDHKKKYESRLDQIVAQGYIRVGTTGDYRPFTYLNPETKQYEGYDIDAAKQLAKSLGVEVRFVQTSWPNMMTDMLADKFDIAVGGVTRNTDRQKKAQMTEGYITFGKSPLIRLEDKDKYKSVEDINKPTVKIGVNPGGTNEVFVREHLKNANVTVVQNNLDIPGLVADGTYDVMITDNIEALTYAKKDKRLYAALSDNTFTKSEKAFMIQRGDTIFENYLDVWMDEMKLQGKFDELRKTWVE
ncbi:transporter substrate-binding domain-containing protein [Paenibacillus chitinolyticus]|uniref:transporter substrate-binding domain-containing protein n=1 Tax=Paenibacillus TaxID=44249 RepID=UPI0020C71BB7|nr:transporter substrate-binding domain-containing protein [Paenibacillus sp. GbtcB18]